ncbi:MAG: trimethylamine methyltransferase family protein [Candidatus Lokiarchaeota archaeon]|nr:trimethylamine methyltransferase family protein [Candidatus Lokiarchaeota archaeon]
MKVEILTDMQLADIHKNTLKILESVGFVIPHEEVLNRFNKIGANVDFIKKKVKIPETIVMDLLSKAGRKFTLYGRDLTKKAEFGVGRRNYNSSAGQAFWIDNIGSERRYASLKDVSTATKFTDALDQITIPGAMADPHEIPVEWRCVSVATEMIKNTIKPIYFWFYDKASAKYLVDIVKTLRGDEKKAEEYPLFFPLFEPVSPLAFPFNGIDLLFETALINMPVMIGPMAQMGMTAPATIAGTLVQENAEILAGICTTQLIREGMPICYGGICHAFDMKKIQIIFSGPEQAIFSIAMAQMGKFYGFPVYINVGLTDSKLPDAQAGLECGLTLAMGSAAGADIFGHMGICGVDQASSLDMLVMQSEVISYVESLNREIYFDDDTFAFDIIKEVGPMGNFLDKSHTRNHFRKELWFPTLLDRDFYDSWRDKGSLTMENRCCERKEEILASYEPKSLESDILKDLELIVKNATKELQKSNK